MVIQLRFFTAVFCMLMISACSLGGSGQPARFYALSPQPGATETLARSAAVSEVAVGPVNLPDMFDRPQIVTRPNDSRVKLAEFDRWAGDLGDSIQRVLIQNLATRLPGVDVTAWPWRGNNPQWQLSVTFFRFDGEPGEQTQVSGDWRLRTIDGGCKTLAQPFDIRGVPAGGGYALFVDSLSEALAQLSQTLAGQLNVYSRQCHR